MDTCTCGQQKTARAKVCRTCYGKKRTCTLPVDAKPTIEFNPEVTCYAADGTVWVKPRGELLFEERSH